MGRLFKYFARLGAPGGTARWVLREYKRLRVVFPNEPIEAIIQHLAVSRIQVFSRPRKDAELLAHTSDLDSLMGLTVELVRNEAGLAQLDWEQFRDVMSVLETEMRKSELSESVLFGLHADMSYFAARAARP